MGKTDPETTTAPKEKQGSIVLPERPTPQSLGWYWYWVFNHDRNFRTSDLLPSKTRVRSGSISAGYDIERARAVGALKLALKDPKPSVRAAAALALGRIAVPGDSVIAELGALTSDGKKEVRRAATLAIGLVGQEAGQRALRALLRGQGQDARVTSYAVMGLGYGPGASKELLGILGSTRDDDVRLASMLGLRLGGDRTAVPTLIKIAGNTNLKYQTRAMAMSVLGRLDTEGQSAQTLERLVRESKSEIGIGALLALGAIKTETARAALGRILVGPKLKPQTRGFAYIAIGLQRDRKHRVALEQAMRKDASTRGYSALALGLMGDPAAADALLEMQHAYRNSAHLDHGAVLVALGLLRESRLVERIPKAWRVVAHEHEYLGLVAEAIGLLGDKSLVPTLVTMFDEHPWIYEVRRSVTISLCLLDARKKAEELLVKEVKSSKPHRRLYCTRLMGEIPSAEQVTRPLAKLLRTSTEEEIRSQAAVALGRVLDRSRWTTQRQGSLSRLGIDFPYQIIRKEDLLKDLFAIP